MDAKIQARIDRDLKDEGEAILKELGISTTDFVRMTFRQLVLQRGLPYAVKIPNAETVAALEEDVSDYPDMTMEDLRKLHESL